MEIETGQNPYQHLLLDNIKTKETITFRFNFAWNREENDDCSSKKFDFFLYRRKGEK
jgi:hypothetical protein